jgi:hypothetical protein
VCDFSTVDEMALSAEDLDLWFSAYMRQGISIDYLPTLLPNREVRRCKRWSPPSLSAITAAYELFEAERIRNRSRYANVQNLTSKRE